MNVIVNKYNDETGKVGTDFLKVYYDYGLELINNGEMSVSHFPNRTTKEWFKDMLYGIIEDRERLEDFYTNYIDGLEDIKIEEIDYHIIPDYGSYVPFENLKKRTNR